MTDKEKRLRAEAYVRLLENSDGRLFASELASDLDTAMRTLLYCPDEELRAARGYARALHEVLKKFDTAKKTLTTQGNTHVAS